jgi:hypothetical protein
MHEAAVTGPQRLPSPTESVPEMSTYPFSRAFVSQSFEQTSFRRKESFEGFAKSSSFKGWGLVENKTPDNYRFMWGMGLN